MARTATDISTPSLAPTSAAANAGLGIADERDRDHAITVPTLSGCGANSHLNPKRVHTPACAPQSVADPVVLTGRDKTTDMFWVADGALWVRGG